MKDAEAIRLLAVDTTRKYLAEMNGLFNWHPTKDDFDFMVNYIFTKTLIIMRRGVKDGMPKM